MLQFLKAVGEAVAAKALKVASEFVPFGDKLYEVGADVIERYRKAGREAKLAADARKAISAKMDVIREDAKQIAREAAAGQPAEIVELVEAYLTQVPAAITQSLKRPDDPTGTTLPAGFAVGSPEDVARMLPPRVPRFRPNMPLPGKAGWVLDRLLGVGGFGEVWFARHDRMTSLHGAVKFCFGQTGRDLIHEADLIDRVMQAGSHPNIVPLKDAHLDGDAPWLMFEYVSGGTLTDWIHALASKPNGQRLPQVRSALRQLAEAVAFFHALPAPVVHRDLKPSNILLDRTAKKLRITDFGIGSVTAQEVNRQESRGQASRGGRLLSHLYGSHTPIYSSPQQRAGVAPDPCDDIHALGVIAYQMLTGKLDGGPGPRAAFALKKLGAPDDLTELLMRCASEELEDRPANGTALVAELAALGTPRPDEPRPAAPILGERRDVGPPVLPSLAPAVPVAPPPRKAGGRREILLPSGVPMAFAWCPPGTFLMGSPTTEKERHLGEQQHSVTLTRGFWMGIHPVTQAQWRAVMGTDPSHFKGDGKKRMTLNGPQQAGDTLPVEMVSWEDAVKFCAVLKRKGRAELRLPTEAEWEYAARGGAVTPFYWGNELNGTQANCDGESPYGTATKGSNMEKTTPVGSYAAKYPHPWGLFDIHGNVWEWCADWYGPYAAGAAVDPTGPSSGSLRVYRGGSYNDYAESCRAANRGNDAPGYRQSFLGFRPAADSLAGPPPPG